jgi:hypothetical protein
MEQLYSIIGPRDVATAAPAKAPKAQKTAAAEAVLTAASDSSKPEQPQAEVSHNGSITVEQLRAAVKEKSTTHREALKKLLTQYGAANVSSLAPEHYHDFLNQVNAL